MNKRKMISAVLSVFSALAGAALLSHLSQGIHWAVLLSCTCIAAFSGLVFWQAKDRRLRRAFGPIGSLAMLASALSVRLRAAQATGWLVLAECLLLALCWGPAASQLFIWLKAGLQRLKTPLSLTGKQAFWLSLGVILLCWLPVFLALFPGVTGYDAYSQIQQNLTGQYVNGHPIAHTLLIGLFYRLGAAVFANASLGIGLYTAVQMLSLGAAVAYALYWLCLRRCPAVLWGMLLALFALAPQHAIMASSLTKDILFAAFMLMLTVELCRWRLEPERARLMRTRLLDAALVFAVGLMRRNLILALGLMLLALLLPRLRRLMDRRLLAVLLAGIVLFSGAEAVLKKAVHAENPTIRDTMALPCQQLARVYHLYGLSHSVGYEIREILPYAENYAPERADQAKRAAKITTPDRLMRFIKLWAREAVHYPVEYLDAFLFTTRAYWDPSDVSYARTYDMEPEGPRGCLTTNHNPYAGIELFDFFPQLRDLYGRLFTDNEALNHLPLRLLIHPAWSAWLLLFALAWAVYERRYALLLALLLSACYLFTLLLGPCAIVRYSYYLMLTAPVLLGGLCCQDAQSA